MALSYTTTIASSLLPAATPSLPNKKSFWIEKEALFRIASKLTAPRNGRSSSVEFDVPFPRDYEELLDQAKKATELAWEDNKQLMEIEFPTAGLESVPGDGEGGIEMTGSMQLIREFCDRFVSPEKTTRTRIHLSLFTNLSMDLSQFFPEANEVKFARQSAFEGSSLKLDYLTKPSFFEDFGFVEKVKMTDRVKPEDELFLVAYPYFNVNEMLVVEELYKEAVVETARKLIIFNGELDRIRSGYYPSFFYPKLASLLKTLFPLMETVYYIHNFKGRSGGILFRCYPGPWKVLRKVRNAYTCLHQQEAMPSLKEVALDILPSV
ncbi:hypothetical protein POTOM_013720 [Populus tomentosa]|uniref:DUF1995 domain-containing protein n=1 Tax=Populus tomentosa TaxID=118781 RepID=A0A8X8A350_POPTO|nr:hypothetical protein POTOM_013720 [Populus tomentosa]